ncbi:hypothetical protein [Micromonospora aurantiaca]|uniref:hypothetical protein n=1 Tax=Micromonospora aurantiaca (nom. illeg.) TaxID=47850 RepID=UPI0037F7F9B2
MNVELQPLDDSALWELIQSVELIDIRLVRLEGELHDFGADKVSDIDPELQTQFRQTEKTIQCLWTLDTEVRDPDGDKIADLGVSVLQVFAFTDPPMNRDIPNELLIEFIEKTAVLSVIPFVREAVQTMSVRLGLSPITFGLVRAGTTGPTAFSVRRHPPGKSA